MDQNSKAINHANVDNIVASSCLAVLFPMQINLCCGNNNYWFSHYIATSPNPYPNQYPNPYSHPTLSHTLILTLTYTLTFTLIKFCRNIVRLP